MANSDDFFKLKLPPRGEIVKEMLLVQVLLLCTDLDPTLRYVVILETGQGKLECVRKIKC